MTDQEFITAHLEREMIGFNGWKETEDGITAIIGPVTITDDDEDAGLYSGDSGTLYAVAVGAEEHHNRRVMLWFALDDDWDAGNEVRDLTLVDFA